MNVEQLVKDWVSDTADHVIVWARDWDPFWRGARCQCEGCGRALSVWPIILAKRAANPRLHILCRAKCMSISLRVSGPVKFGGTIQENVLPEKLEKFGTDLLK
jgi:hypothetical protein